MGVQVSLLYVSYTNLDIPSKEGKSGAASIHGTDIQEQQGSLRAHQSLRQHPVSEQSTSQMWSISK